MHIIFKSIYLFAVPNETPSHCSGPLWIVVCSAQLCARPRRRTPQHIIYARSACDADAGQQKPQTPTPNRSKDHTKRAYPFHTAKPKRINLHQ